MKQNLWSTPRTPVAAAAKQADVWEPAVELVQRTAPQPLAIENEFIELLQSPVDATETHRAGNERKERELYALLDTLTELEAHQLRLRLAARLKNDPLVSAFDRLIADRRVRVTAFLADTRRRRARR